VSTALGIYVPEDYANDVGRCAIPSAFMEFFEIASEAWFFCLAIDLATSLSNPFSSFKSRYLFLA